MHNLYLKTGVLQDRPDPWPKHRTARTPATVGVVATRDEGVGDAGNSLR